jgi:hypothetical protein
VRKRRLTEVEYRTLGQMLREAAENDKYVTLVGHSKGSVTSKYIHTLDTALIIGADTISGNIQGLLEGIRSRRGTSPGCVRPRPKPLDQDGAGSD